MKGIIYKVTNKINGKCYIGQTIQLLKNRKCAHLSSSRHNSKSHFHRSIRKYGEDKFIWEIIIEGDHTKFELNVLEFLNIKKFKSLSQLNGYNMTSGGEGVESYLVSGQNNPASSSNMSKEKRIQKAIKGYKKRKLPLRRKNWLLLDSTKLKISKTRIENGLSKGQNNPASSTNMSKEKRMAKAQKANKTKINNGGFIKGKDHYMFGKKMSQEFKNKISKTRKEKGLSKGALNPKAKTFIIISPLNKKYEVVGNLKIFCVDHNISYSLITRNKNKGIIKENKFAQKTDLYKNTIGWEIKI